MASQPEAYLSPQDYLARERSGMEKSEYLDGLVYAMGGASEDHNLITANLIALLWSQLRSSGCRVYPSDMKVATPGGKRYFYPDLSVICGQTQFVDGHADAALNPTVVIEVLSESTAAFDRGKKFLAYQAIPSLQEYLLIHQDAAVIEHYRRNPSETWLYSKTEGLPHAIQLPSVACTLALEEVYLNVQLDR